MASFVTISVVAILLGGLVILLAYACRTLLKMHEMALYPLIRVRTGVGAMQLVARVKQSGTYQLISRREPW